MLNSKAIEILNTFSSAEMKRFGEFLNSPFHNKNKKAIALFNILLKFHNNYDDKKLTKEMLFEKLFDTGGNRIKFNDASIRNLLSDLLILEEKFLSQLHFEKDRFDFYEKCLREMTERKLWNAFEKKVKTAEDILDAGKFQGEDRFYKKYVLEELKSFNRQFSDNLRLYKDDSMSKAMDHLSYFYLIRVFKIMNFFEFQKQYNIRHENLFSGMLIEKLDMKGAFDEKNVKPGKDALIAGVYYKMYMAMKYPLKDDLYFEFKKALQEFENYFAPLEVYGLYVCLTNCCVQKIDLGKEDFFRECFEVYELMFEKDLFTAYPGFFPMGAYTAVVNTGISAGEYERVEKFIRGYSGKLNPEYKSDAEYYSMAQLNFARKNYPSALEYISKTNTEFSNFKYHLRILQMKIYFETKDFDSLDYALDSFRHFLSKNKLVGENYRKEFSAFIRIVEMLVRYEFSKDKTLLREINRRIEDKSIAGRSWLLKKISDMT